MKKAIYILLIVMSGVSFGADENADIIDFWRSADTENDQLKLMAPVAQLINSAAVNAMSEQLEPMHINTLPSQLLQQLAAPDVGTKISDILSNVKANEILSYLGAADEAWIQTWREIKSKSPELVVLGEPEVKKYAVGTMILANHQTDLPLWEYRFEDRSKYLCFWIIGCPPPPKRP